MTPENLEQAVILPALCARLAKLLSPLSAEAHFLQVPQTGTPIQCLPGLMMSSSYEAFVVAQWQRGQGDHLAVGFAC